MFKIPGFLRFTVVSFLLSMIFIESQAIGMRCVSVGANGDVTVTWDRGLTTGTNFRCWYLYHSTSATGPFTAVDSVFFYNDTSEVHVGANASNNPAYYYVAFKFNNGSPDQLSDSIRALGLIVSNPGSGYASLGWNPTRSPLIPTNSVWYKIYREYPATIFTLIDSVDASVAPSPMLYEDLISICDDTIKYRIEVMDQSGCRSISPVKGDRFRDLVTPTIPVLDSVSVDITGTVIVSWLINPSVDTKVYSVLQSIGAIWQPLDTVTGRGSTIYNSSIQATAQSETFSLIAIDSCNNPSGRGIDHSTIYLTTSFDLCSKSVSLNWNAYSYWTVLPEYDILLSINGAPEVVIGTTTGTNFTDTNLISGSSFCYRVRAIDQGSVVRRTSTSNVSCQVPVFPPPPAFSYIRSVSVTSESNVEIVVYVDPVSTVSGYRLFRSDSPTGVFTQVGSILTNGVSSVTFNDNVNTSEGPYYYEVYTYDSCGVKSFESQVSQTILLTGISPEQYVNSLEWTNYSQWPAGVGQYNLYLTVNGVTSPIPVATFLPGDSTYIQSVLNSFYSDGNFCYVIEAVEAPGNPYFFQDTARSNEVCLIQEPNIFIPNAFHPGGFLNEIFTPSNAFVSTENYSLRIFNRWGEMIFETTDPKVGWDGTTNGRYAPEAVYVYLLQAVQADGSEILRKGSVTLIR